ncbi:MAG TPA: glycosyltransferase family 4 protein [Thermoanaerobaculia bacterium]|nr:glycosyltransferase family 4 protein [Thermoanaerobaculia bacterium]
MRIAFFSPLPPQTSGIADYSAELLPELARHLEIELIIEDGFRPARELADRFPVHEIAAFPGLAGAGRFDCVLYHLGNNRDYHAAIYRTVLDYPGVVVLHEFVLHHLVRDLTLFAGDPAAYVRELRYAYGLSGEAMARRCLETGVPLDPWAYPLFERVVDRSRGLIVHNRTTERRVLASRPLARLARVPHHLSLRGVSGLAADTANAADAADRQAARAALGIPPEAYVVATFGFLTAAKRPGVLLRAFARFRREAPHARLLLVGEVSPHFDFASLATPDLMAGVSVTGRLELAGFLSYMAAADLAVNLRHPSAGETSGTLIRLLGMGKPVVVSNTGAFAEVPDGCCAKVDVGDGEEDLLLAYLQRLAADEPLRRQMGDNARRHVATHHSLAASARAYADFLHATVATGAAPFRALPPLAPYPPEDLLSDLVRDLAADLSDLGLTEADDDLLAPFAAALVDLDLDLAAS